MVNILPAVQMLTAVIRNMVLYVHSLKNLNYMTGPAKSNI